MNLHESRPANSATALRSIKTVIALTFTAAPLALSVASPANAIEMASATADIRMAEHSISTQALYRRSSKIVSSTQGWQTTSVLVSQGKKYNVRQIAGQWTVDHRNFGYVDGNGYPPEIDQQIFQGCKVDSSLPYGTLLARVDNGSPFRVGRGLTFTATSSGVLEFRINDADDCLGDNAGDLTVQIKSPSTSGTDEFAEFVETIRDIVAAGDAICKIVDCHTAWSANFGGT